MSTTQLTPVTHSLQSRRGSVPQPILAMVDQYQLLRLLGWGGVGVVYEAQDTSLLRRVAIKLIPNEHSKDGVAQAMLREAQFAREVADPHVVTLYDTGTYRGGDYLVMELVEGGSVQSLVRNGPL